MLGTRTLLLEQAAARIAIDLRGGALSLIDDGGRATAAGRLSENSVAELVAGAPRVRLRRVARDPDRYRLATRRVLAHVETRPVHGVDRGGVELVWMLLLGFVPSPPIGYAVPANVEVRELDDPDAVVLRAALRSTERTDEPRFPAATAATDPPTTKIDDDSTWTGPGRVRLASGPRGELPSDFAFLARQPALDQIREIVNRVWCTFNEFSGTPSPANPGLHLVVDWFQQLAAVPGATAFTPLLPGIARLALFGRLMGDLSAIGSLTPAEVAAIEADRESVFRNLMEGQQVGSLSPDQLARVEAEQRQAARVRTAFRARFEPSVLGQARFDAVADAELTVLTAPRTLAPRDASGAPLSVVRGTMDADGVLVDFRATSFSTRLSILGLPLIEALELRDGCIRLVLSIASARVDFSLMLRRGGPMESLTTDEGDAGHLDDIGRGFGDIVEGVALWAQGDASVTFAGALALDLGWDATGPTARIDQDASSMTASVVTQVAPAVDFGLTVAQFVSDQVRTALLDRVEEVIADALGTLGGGSWPSSWHAAGAPPPVVGGSEVTPAAAALTGRVDPPPAPAMGSPFDGTRVTNTGVAMTRRYLSRWVQTVCGVHSTASVPASLAEFEAATGVDLPEPVAERSSTLTPTRSTRRITIDGMEVAFVDRGLTIATDEPDHVLTVARSAPRVEFPEKGPLSGRAGQVRIAYHARIETTVHSVASVPALVVEPGRRFELPSSGRAGGLDLPGGIGDPDERVPELQPHGETYRESVVIELTDSVKTFLNAELTVVADFVLGLDPELGAERFMPRLHFQVPPAPAPEALVTAGMTLGSPLTQAHEPAVRAFLTDLALRDSAPILAALRSPRDPVARRTILPAQLLEVALGDAAEARLFAELIVFEQTGFSDGTPFAYYAERALHWDLDVRQSIAPLLPPLPA